MASRLRRSEAGAEGVRRIVRRETRNALRRLAAGRRVGDTSVHEARKALKRARAALRLLRSRLGARAYRRENHTLRDAARPLSLLRDARILLDTLEELVSGAPRRDRAALRRVVPELERHRRSVRKRCLEKDDPWKDVGKGLRAAGRRAKRWKLGDHGWSVLGRGLEKTYRAGRQAFETASRARSAENLHEWRKQSKYLWHELQFLEPARPRALRKLADRTHELSDRLGKDHDLVVLRPRLRRKDLMAHVDRARGRLQEQALALGAQVYAETPPRFTKRIESYWRSWRRS